VEVLPQMPMRVNIENGIITIKTEHGTFTFKDGELEFVHDDPECRFLNMTDLENPEVFRLLPRDMIIWNWFQGYVNGTRTYFVSEGPTSWFFNTKEFLWVCRTDIPKDYWKDSTTIQTLSAYTLTVLLSVVIP
jgi:hypothetical protein